MNIIMIYTGIYWVHHNLQYNLILSIGITIRHNQKYTYIY